MHGTDLIDADWSWDAAATAILSGSERPNILVAGGGEVSTLLFGLLSREGYSVTCVADGRAALEQLRTRPVDLVLLDQHLAGLDGTSVCRLIKRNQATRFVPVVLLLAEGASRDERIAGVEAGVDDVLPAPVDLRELLSRLGSLIRRKRYMDDFEQATSVMTTLAALVEARVHYTDGHYHRMANYAAALGRRIGLSGQEVHVLRRGGYLHDIGMIVVPDAVLLKLTPLDPDEQALIRTHVMVGDSLLANLRSLKPVRGIVRHHHERRDGSGYPDGLRGDEIPLLAQIVGLVDVFEALTTPRPYHEALSTRGALQVLQRHAAEGRHRLDLVEELSNVLHAAEAEPSR